MHDDEKLFDDATRGWQVLSRDQLEHLIWRSWKFQKSDKDRDTYRKMGEKLQFLTKVNDGHFEDRIILNKDDL